MEVRMNRTLVAVLLVVILAFGAFVIVSGMGPSQAVAGPTEQAVGLPADSPASSSAPAVFAMKYRGFDAPDDPLSYHSFSQSRRPDEPNNPFALAVKSRVKECTLVYNEALPKAKWSVVELQDKKPMAFYFDANADGKFSDNEKFPPTKPAGKDFGYPYAFVTSDFMLQTGDNREIPFRIMLVGYAYGDNQVSWMWSPCCILEGEATLAGKPVKLFLFGDGFSGSFTTFGPCRYALLPAGEKLPEYPPRAPLSSLIQHEGAFYRVKLDGTHEKDKTIRVSFEKDTSPTGKMTVALQGKETLKTRLTSVGIAGGTDSSIRFSVSSAESTYPVGQYRLSSAYLTYGVQSDDEWQMNFSGGPAFEIKADQTSRVELGGLTLSLRAVREQDRYRSDVKEQTTFPKGTAICLTPRIQGKAGDAYTRFSQKTAGANNVTDVKPHLTITDPGGKQIVSTDLEYG
jgi:hypothetical protein